MPSTGKTAETPNAEEDCFWHSRQWHTSTARGLGSTARKDTAPQWQRIMGLVSMPAVRAKQATLFYSLILGWRRCALMHEYFVDEIKMFN
jgi:hypothetical protein